jgi:hypothetical protein
MLKIFVICDWEGAVIEKIIFCELGQTHKIMFFQTFFCQQHFAASFGQTRVFASLPATSSMRCVPVGFTRPTDVYAARAAYSTPSAISQILLIIFI